MPLREIMFVGGILSALMIKLEAGVNSHTRTGKITGYNVSSYREITPEAGPRVAHGADAALSVDFIYWQSDLEGLQYAIEGSEQGGRTLRPESGFDPGFKIALGLNIDHDGWDIIAEYTSLRSDSAANPCQDSANLDSGSIYPLWNIGGAVSQNPSGILNATLNKWKLRFNVIDLAMGRNFFISQHLKVRPFVGFKSAWIDQIYEVTYHGLHKLQMRQDHDSWGLGLRMGVNLAWHFAKNWSLYGYTALSTLWSQFIVHRFDTDTLVGNPAMEKINMDGDPGHRLKPVLEFSLGLRWQMWFGKHENHHVLLQAGWETQVWWNHNHMITLRQGFSHGNLGLQGLTVKLQLDF